MTIKFCRFFTISLLILFLSGCTRSIIETANQGTVNSLEHKNVTEVLNELIQLDIDTVHAYSQVIQVISNKRFKEQLIGFRDDHERHIRTLSKAVLDLGGHQPSFSRDFKGFMTAGYTAIKSVSTKQALEAMETNEVISNKYYDKALLTPMPENIRSTVAQNRKDEQRHLVTIKKMKEEASKK